MTIALGKPVVPLKIGQLERRTAGLLEYLPGI